MAVTSKFIRVLRDNSGLVKTGASVVIVPQANTYPTGALSLTESGTRPGYYSRSSVPIGEYKLYIDETGGNDDFVLYEENIWHGESVLSNISAKFDANNQLIESGIKDGAVTVNKLADGVVSEAKIANSAVTVNKLAINSVTTTKLAINSVTVDKIADSNVTNAKLGNNSVTAVKIADGAVTTDKIGNNSVSTAKLVDSAVTIDKIDDGAVVESKISVGAVTTAKIDDGAVVETKIADGAVTVNKLVGGNYGYTFIGDGFSGVTFGQLPEDGIANSAVTTDKISDGAVTEAKIDNGAVGSLTNRKFRNITNQTNNDLRLDENYAGHLIKLTGTFNIELDGLDVPVGSVFTLINIGTGTITIDSTVNSEILISSGNGTDLVGKGSFVELIYLGVVGSNRTWFAKGTLV